MPLRAPAPMLARLEDDLPTGAYSYEPKWDGFRCLAEHAPEGVALHSRHGRPLARNFPEVAAAVEALPPGTVVDGELVVGVPGGGVRRPTTSRTSPASARW
jgi:ATP-dependent DNA ligase